MKAQINSRYVLEIGLGKSRSGILGCVHEDYKIFLLSMSAVFELLQLLN